MWKSGCVSSFVQISWKQLPLRWRAYYSKSEVIRQSFQLEFSDDYSYVYERLLTLYQHILVFVTICRSWKDN